jgi:uncharacterized integral membrane protein
MNQAQSTLGVGGLFSPICGISTIESFCQKVDEKDELSRLIPKADCHQV